MSQKDSSALTKQQRRDAARAEAARLRAEQERRDKRNKLLFILGGVALVALVGVAAFFIMTSGNKSALEGVNRPEGSDLQGGIPVSSSLVAGEAAEGTVRVDVYSDYTCSYCNQFETINAADLEAMASEGLITVWFHPVATLDDTTTFTGYSGLATNAAATVAQYAPEHFLAANSALFDLFWGAVQSGATTAPGLAEIQAALAAAGVPQDVVTRVADGEFADWVQATTRQFGRDGYKGTPTIEINDETFNGWQQEGALRSAVEALGQ